LHQQPPPVPPRTYPLPPPSNLPFLLASLFRIVSWSIGLSGILALAYYKCLLPRISRSLDARHFLKLHQVDLLKRLHTHLHDVKSEAFTALDVAHRPEKFKSFNDIPLDDHGLPTCSLSSVIYCAFSESSAAEYTVDAIYELLTNRYPGLAKGESAELKNSILQQLSQSTLYTKLQGDGDVWILRKDENSLPTLSRLETLHRAVRQANNKENRGTYSYTFKALTDLTAYISRETFVTYGGTSGFRHGFSTSTQMTPAQEEVRREIRALKGLVLNRRSFAPIPPRASVPTIDPVAPS